MKVEYEAKQEPITATITKPIPWTLTLTAKGSHAEIEWLKKQLAKIGKK